MPFDESGRQRRAGQIDDLRAGGGDRRRRPDGVDALALHAHGPALVHRVAVEHARRLQDRDGVVLRAGADAAWPRTRNGAATISAAARTNRLSCMRGIIVNGAC